MLSYYEAASAAGLLHVHMLSKLQNEPVFGLYLIPIIDIIVVRSRLLVIEKALKCGQVLQRIDLNIQNL